MKKVDLDCRSSKTKNWAWDYLCLDSIRFFGEGIDVAIIDSGYNEDIECIKHIEKHRSIDFTKKNSQKIINELKDIIPLSKKLDFLALNHEWDTVNEDPISHGSKIASIIGGRSINNSNRGIAPACNMIILKVVYNSHEESKKDEDDLLAIAILWCAANKIPLVNISRKHSKGCDLLLHDAVKAAYMNNTVLVCSAGNSPSSDARNMTIEYPAAFQKTLAIGSFKQSLNSNNIEVDLNMDQGNLLDFAMPGTDVPSFIDPDNFYKDGTSISAAFATGVIALILEKEGFMNYHQLKSHLTSKAFKPSCENHSPEWGYGIIHPKKYL